MQTLLNLSTRVNLKGAVVLLIEANAQGMGVLSQILAGFGVKRVLKADSFEAACELVQTQVFDLIISEGPLAPGEKDGYDFVHWLRRSQLEPNSYTPVVIASAHTSLRDVIRARDCGANFFITRPIAPVVMLERIVWIARENKPFVSCPVYMGPDRRFKCIGPPPKSDGRRSTDLSAQVGAAVEPNMSQDEIDSLMQPKKAAR